MLQDLLIRREGERSPSGWTVIQVMHEPVPAMARNGSPKRWNPVIALGQVTAESVLMTVSGSHVGSHPFGPYVAYTFRYNRDISIPAWLQCRAAVPDISRERLLQGVPRNPL